MRRELDRVTAVPISHGVVHDGAGLMLDGADQLIGAEIAELHERRADATGHDDAIHGRVVLMEVDLAVAQQNLAEVHVRIGRGGVDDPPFLEVDDVVAAVGVEADHRGLAAADERPEEVGDRRFGEGSLNGEIVFGHLFQIVAGRVASSTVASPTAFFVVDFTRYMARSAWRMRSSFDMACSG
jgi:hypothetical protein